jgi:hypothetical protein
MIYLIRQVNEQGCYIRNDVICYSRKNVYKTVDSSKWEYYRVYRIWEIKKPEIIMENMPFFHDFKCEIKKSSNVNEMFKRKRSDDCIQMIDVREILALHPSQILANELK